MNNYTVYSKNIDANPYITGCDTYTNIKNIGREFVISRDSEGNIISIYENNHWEFNQDHLDSHKYSHKINFDTIFQETKSQAIVNEAKNIILNLLFDYNSRNNFLSISTIQVYFSIIRAVCITAKNINISLRSFLENEQLCKRYFKKNPSIYKLLNALSSIDIEKTKINIRYFQTLNQMKELSYKEININQTLLIPPNIFSQIIETAKSFIDGITGYIEQILLFLIKVNSDLCYARSTSFQYKKGVPRTDQKPEFQRAIQEHKLCEFIKYNHIDNVKEFQEHICKAQSYCLIMILAFSGMRKSEAFNLSLDSLESRVVNGTKVYLLNGHTKKFGRKKAAWVTSKEIIPTITLLEKLSSVNEANINTHQPRKIFQPINTNKNYSSEKALYRVITDRFKRLKLPTISEDDINFISANDPYANFMNQNIKAGNVWPLKSHQFRRSLAVYVAQSGVVNFTSLKSQLKHVTDTMSFYYAKGSAFSIGSSIKYKNSFINEVNELRPIIESNQYMKSIVLSTDQLHGAQGKVIERQKNTDLNIILDKDATLKKFKNGLLSYKETHLGACMKTGPCQDRGMLAITACINCKSAVIKEKKLNNVIKYQEQYISELKKDSIEYRYEINDLIDLKRFANHIRSK